MKKQEAEELKKIIDSFVESEKGINSVVEETEIKPEIVLTEEELNKLFRREVPEGFNLKETKIVRSKSTGDRVFLIFREKKYWIPDIETLEKIGFNLGDVEEVSDEEIKKYSEGYAFFSVKLW